MLKWSTWKWDIIYILCVLPQKEETHTHTFFVFFFLFVKRRDSCCETLIYARVCFQRFNLIFAWKMLLFVGNWIRADVVFSVYFHRMPSLFSYMKSIYNFNALILPFSVLDLTFNRKGVEQEFIIQYKLWAKWWRTRYK